jgi:hypothetical protein
MRAVFFLNRSWRVLAQGLTVARIIDENYNVRIVRIELLTEIK